MKEIVLSGVHWTTEQDFYNALLLSLGAPDWHGHNLDALWDSITGGDINQVKLPFRIVIAGLDMIPPNCRALIDRFVAMISEAKAEGFAVEVVCR
jgi:RNAse (barnase) inhibitor barstar